MQPVEGADDAPGQGPRPTLRVSLWERVRNDFHDLLQPESRTRTEALQVAKSTLAAIVAWYIAAQMVGSVAAWLAPTTAVLMVHSTVYRSVTEGLKRVVAVVAGVTIAAAAGHLIGLNAYGLLLVVPISLIGARLRWISTQGEYVAVTAVLLLAFGVATNEGFLLSYVSDTAVGCVTGAAVNVLLFPPAWQRGTRVAVAEVAANIAWVLRDMAQGARTGWSPERAAQWRRYGDTLRGEAQTAQTALAWSLEGQRWNPWPRRESRKTTRRYQPSVDTLSHLSIEVRALAATMEDAVQTGALIDPVPTVVQEDLAPLLEAVAGVVDTFAEVPAEPGSSPRATGSLAAAEALYAEMARHLPRAAVTDARLFEHAGAILRDLRRILNYLRAGGQG